MNMKVFDDFRNGITTPVNMGDAMYLGDFSK